MRNTHGNKIHMSEMSNAQFMTNTRVPVTRLTTLVHIFWYLNTKYDSILS